MMDNGNNDPIFERTRPLLFAHRGGGLEQPESTERAFRHAIQVAKADVLEVDIQAILVSDNSDDLEIVVWHGPGLDNVRIDSGDGERREGIHRYCWSELRDLAWVAPPGWGLPLTEVPKTNDTRLMTLTSLLELLGELDPTRSVGLNIEVKGETFKSDDDRTRDRVQQVLQVVKAEPGARKVLLASQDREILNIVEELDPDMPRGLSFWDACKPDNIDHWANRALQTAWFPFACRSKRIKEIHDRGGACHVFITEPFGLDREPHWPREEVLFRLFRRGVDGVMTDRPFRVRRIIDRWRRSPHDRSSSAS